MIALASCQQEIADFTDRLDDLESRVSKLELLCQEINSNISSLQSIVTAMQSGDYITSVNPITEGGKTIGYTISFAKGNPITIYHGEDGADGKDGVDGKDGQNGTNGKDGKDGADGHTPIIGVQQDTDGIWYWTIDGEWLLDGNGQKVKAVGLDGKDGADGKDGQDGQNGTNGQDGQDGKDGVTPQLKIEDGYWYVSTDNGQTWTQLGNATGENGKDGTDGKDGKDGDSMFQSVTVTETDVTFVTADGQTFVIKRASALSIEFDSADLVVMGTNATRDIHYTITSGLDDITIEALSSADIKVKVVKTDAKTGALQVKTGATIDEYSKVVVLVSNGSQAIMRTLNFEKEAIEVEENTTKEVSDEGGEVTLEFFSNVPCHAVIPEEAQSWISVAPPTRGMTRQTIDLIVQPNDGLSRSATINVVGEDEASSVVLTYTVTQAAGGVWKDGTVPPDNEIWYITSDNNKINIPQTTVYGTLPFNKEIISHSYDNGRGTIVFDGPVSSVNDYAFGSASNKNLIGLFLPDCVQYLGIQQSSGIKNLYIPRDLSTFRACSLTCYPYLEKFYGNNVSSDGRCFILDDELVAFASAGITDYSLPESIKVIRSEVFSHSSLEHIELPEGLLSIGGDAFYDCPLESVFFPYSLQKVHPYAFRSCKRLKGFYGNSSFHTDDNYCFITHGNMAYSLPYDDSEEICLNLFVGDELTEYTIPEGITFIQNYAFEEKSNLKTIYFPSTITDMPSLSFFNCDNIEYVGGSIASEDHQSVVIGNSFIKLLVRKGVKEYTVPQGVKIVYGGAFCDNFESNCELEKIVLNDEAEELIGFAAKSFGASIGNHLKTLVLSQNLKKIKFYGQLDLPLLQEVFLKSLAPPTVSAYGFAANHHSKLKMYVPEQSLDAYLSKPDWEGFWDFIQGYSYPDLSGDYYVSTDYSHDGDTMALKTSIIGAGINLILMGDAFSDRQIADGTYANVMQKAADAFFSEEPYKTMKDRFNVYTVNVVSATEGYEHSGQALSTGHGDGTYVYGNDSKVIEYAKKAVGEDRLDDALVIVMMNEDAYAGTCFMYNPPSGNYGRGLSIAYFPTSSDTDTFNGLVSHEAGGHGFAKLADEYAYESMGAISADAISSTKVQEPYGWWKNVDFTSDPAQVKWSQFLSDPRYANEALGCYEGGLTYWTGVWRPTEASIMRYNTGGFNAPSRYAIWYRIGKLAYGESWEGSYEDFVAYDQVNRTPAAVQKRKAQINRRKLTKPLPPLPAPVVIGHSWREELQKQ